jgi:hypothetical protein
MPDHAKIIGQGLGHGVTGSGTTLEAGSSFPVSNFMIQMGYFGTPTGYSASPCNASSVCVDVSVEGVILSDTVNGRSGVGGILNANSQELSYVNRVSFLNLPGTGLQVGLPTGSSGPTLAQNSGPYSNIWAEMGTAASGAHCAQIITVQTRGIHGMTCVASNGATPASGILLDAHNNVLENIHFEGFQDGILVGSLQLAASNTLININGSDASGAGSIFKCGAHRQPKFRHRPKRAVC